MSEEIPRPAFGIGSINYGLNEGLKERHRPFPQTRNIDSLHLVDFERISPPLSMHASPDEPVGTASSSARVVAAPRDPTPGLSPPPLVPTTSTSPPAVVPSPPTPAPVVVASSSPPIVSSSPSAPETATARRLRGLPRLLSSEGYGFPTLSALRRNSTVPPSSPPEEDEQEADETETEQEETETEVEETDTDEETDDDDDDDDAEGRPGYTSADEGHPSTPGPAPATASTPRLGFGGASSSPSFAQSTSSWVTFNPFTPTPGIGGPLQTARITDDAGGGGQSYFDLPRGSTSSSATATLAAGSKTPRMSMSGGGVGGGGMMSPLLPMSMSSAARGKRPTRQDEVVEGESTEGTTTMEPALGSTIYRRRSHSVVNVMSPGLGSLHDNDAIYDPSSSSSNATSTTIPTEQETLDPIWRSNVPSSTPLSPPPAFLSPSLPNAPLLSPSLRPPPPPKLGRPRSMYELHVAPPAYHSVYIRPGLQAGQIVFPREEEGREPLPSYTCAVHYESYMPRKMEFVAPTVQAKDRAWKRQYIVLHGTAIKVYKYDLRTHPIPGEEDWSEVDTSMAGSDGPPPLHFHVGEYGSSTPSTPSANSSSSTSHPPPPSSKFPSSIIDARALAKSRLAAAAAAAAATTTGHHGHNVLLRHYSLQNAESGLAADYIKRKHAVRVRAEGEQFLLQAKDDRGVIDLIEALQAATNVALDLDTRLPPKFITLPRRRRRRRRPEGDAAAGSTGPASENAVPPSADDSQLGDMLAEEQPDMLASLIPLALGLVLVLAPSAIANYAPTTAACPTTFLQSTGSPKDGSQTLAAGESTYITKRRTNVVKSLWATYLSDSTSGTTGYATSSLVPRVSIAVSGGGYRSALFAAGTLSAFDSRNSSSIAPLLQLADYISGTSGGSWFVTSLAMNNMPDLFVLPCPGKQQPRWKADHSIVAPASGSLAAAEDALYCRALSFHFFNSTTDSNFYNPAIPHDNALLFSDIKYTANFDSAALPYPIVVTTSRVSVDDQTDSESPFTVIPITNTQFEITPYTFGSFDPTLAAHIPVENAGTRLVNGALPSGTTKCTIGLENAGFVIGSSAALFNALDDISDANTVITDWDDFASAFDGLSSTDDSIPLVANWPNSFEGYVPTTGYTFESAGNKILELTDGGEDSQNIPLGPLLVKARAQDMILALDASADVAEAGGFWQTLLDGEPSLDGGWPADCYADGVVESAAKTARKARAFGYPPTTA
ncbi:hypothetical protein RQP46_001345 [Phenoliferia psychrophenolica]